MKDTIELIIDGSKVEGIYQDGLADLLDAREVLVCRASNVEWERGGWTVRSAHNPDRAIRSTMVGYGQYSVSDDLSRNIIIFPTRAEALEAEVTHFQELIQGRNFNG